MPMMKGSAQHIIGNNIAEMRKAGHSEKSAIAAAYRMAGKHRKTMKKRTSSPTSSQRPPAPPLHMPKGSIG